VHGQEAFENAVKASEILFGNSTSEDLKMLDEKTFLDVFDGVPQAQIQHQDLTDGLNIVAALAERTGFLKSNGEARRALKENSIAVNKEKVAENYSLSNSDLMNGQFILLQRGKKNYFIIKVI
jgi:tyrosyl-tRNA synthetase